jgi:hypothetical protein
MFPCTLWRAGALLDDQAPAIFIGSPSVSLATTFAEPCRSSRTGSFRPDRTPQCRHSHETAKRCSSFIDCNTLKPWMTKIHGFKRAPAAAAAAAATTAAAAAAAAMQRNTRSKGKQKHTK